MYGRIIYQNSEVVEVFGYEKSELVNQKVEKLIPLTLGEQHNRRRPHISEDKTAKLNIVVIDDDYVDLENVRR